MHTLNTRYRLGYVSAENRAVTPVPQWAKALVPKPEGSNQTVVAEHEDTVRDTMPLIKNKIYRTLNHTKKLAPRLKGSTTTDTARKDWNFIFNHIKYVKDEPGKEQIRSPRRLIHDGKGDCDCFTVTLSSLLINQGIPHFLRIMKEEEEWSHIYIVIPKDGNIKKKLTSRDQYIVLDCVTHKFDFEPPHKTTKDFPMALQYLDGLGQTDKACPTKPVAQRLRRFIYTEQVLEKGLVPTKQFLEQHKIPALPQDNGSLAVTTPSGLVTVPSIITPEQAEKLITEVKGAEAVEQMKASVPAELVKAEAGTNNWLWYLVIGGMGAALLFAEDPNTPTKKENTPLNLGALKGKKKLKTLRI